MTSAPLHGLRVATVAALLVAGLVGSAGAAGADGGVTVAGDTTYTVTDRAASARMVVDLTNVTPNRDTGGGSYVYYFFNRISVPVPSGATNLRATSRGATLGTSRSSTKDPGTDLVEISFPDLLYRRQRTLELTFDVRGAAHRSKDPTRVGRGYASFVVSGPGDPGSARLTVRTPTGYDFSSTSDDFSSGTSGGRATHTLSDVTDGGPGLWAVVSLRDPDAATERDIRVGDLPLTLSSFPDDARWTAFAERTVTRGIPMLERLTGTRWPGGLKTVREDSSPLVQGYDGWFDLAEDEIVVGEQLDPDLVFHELSHAWFQDERFVERWLSEGLAQITAERAVRATKGTVRPHRKVSRSAKDAVALQSWEDLGGRSEPVDAYAYPASYRVMKDLLGDLPDEEFAALVAAGIRGERAYDPRGVLTGSAGRTTTTDWLDLLEIRGGIEDAPDVFEHWVLTTAQRRQLPARRAALAAYETLDAADGDWLPPEGLRTAMSTWDFERAAGVRAEVAPLGRAARTVQDAARRAGLPVPESVRDRYQGAFEEAHYRAVAARLPETARTLDAVGAARRVVRAERDPFSALGALVLAVDATERGAEHRLAAGELPRARALADEVTGRSGWLLPLGLGLPVLALLLLVGTALGVRALVRRRSARRPAPVAADGPELLEPAAG
ncbi:hypothetical protein [Arthrobacter sp. NEB 688]|uniref:hypothetical protein n=1 Tax=Arthrobacter sp. NEB 688 TaxID=904039 RepID=UPI001563E1A3|nr:hypothetical protein [Arthrobacter sp. NEB 688]QKE83234.1 hypothetical protein HL663_04270 [Arthrobacter sp. NEB 688]